jgi:tRNA nucleotidyltransferase/poly(A) polymerase
LWVIRYWVFVVSNQAVAISVIERLRDEGFEALLAGGCVRDRLLGRQAKDYDVATSAEPAQVMALFKRTLKVGARFGVVIVMMGQDPIEVATFRSDAEYVDGRRPTQVHFTTAQEDAARRDFTINGMFYDPLEDRLIDYVGGEADLKKRVIRTIGQPDARFQEDYLRMLRAVRFSAQLDFEIAPPTLEAVQRYAPRIEKISQERISMEMEGILCCDNRARGVRLLADTNLADVIFSGMASDDLSKACAVLEHLASPVSYGLGLAALFVALEVDTALTHVEGLKLSRQQVRHVAYLVEHRGDLLEVPMSLAQLKLLAGTPHYPDLLAFQKAIQLAGHESLESLATFEQRVAALGDTPLRPEPLLNGHDLMALGIPTGPELGQVAKALYLAQLEGTVKTKEEAEQWVRDASVSGC